MTMTEVVVAIVVVVVLFVFLSTLQVSIKDFFSKCDQIRK